MCGIAGLLLRDAELEPRLGELVVPMLIALSERGPDSTGVGLYSDGGSGGDGTTGPTLEVVKDVGPAESVSERYRLTARTGYMAVGHTRMATESAVTAAHCHPFTASGQLCLVHNGSFSNHNSVRRRLQGQGVSFDSDNDSEVAARYVGHKISAGWDLASALLGVSADLDGFFTLVVATPGGMAVVRDAFACKPMVMAETDAYVAVASEYRALATLPGIEQALVSEPEPEEVYSWTR